MSNPLISIIVPTLNQGNFIEKTLNSLLNQSYEPKEIIVIDGGSQDNTIDILEKYSSKILWISEADGGEYFAINKGIELSKGTYIKYCPSDDLLAPDATKICVEYLENHKDVDLVYSQFAFIDINDNILEFSCQQYPFNFKDFLQRKYSHGSMTMVFRKSVYNFVNGFNTKFQYTADFEFILNVSSKGFSVVYLPYILGGFRKYPNHQSIRLKRKIWKQTFSIIHNYGNRFDVFVVYKKYFAISLFTILGKIKWYVLNIFRYPNKSYTCDYNFYKLFNS